jgi:3-oxoacyl-[acyl-carrier-protein] synthase-3/clorobiocin biosynthesis protein CloN2
MRVQDIWLAGAGVYVPPSQAISLAGTPDRVARVAVAGDMSAPDMALHAARRAFASGSAGPGDVSMLVYVDVWHQGPDGWGPHSYLQRHFGLGQSLAFELRAGCTGVFAAAELAVSHLDRRGPDDAALIVSSDNFGTKLVDRWCMGRFQGAVGDGAAALLLARRPGFARVLSVAGTTFAEMEAVHRDGEPLFPPPVTEGRYMDLGTRAASFQERAARRGEWLNLMLGHRDHSIGVVEEALADSGTSRRDISKILIHSMPRPTARTYLDSLGFTLDRSSWSFAETTGHVAASDHVLALHHLLSAGQLAPGDRVLLTGFSPGITYKAMVLEITDVQPFRNQKETSMNGFPS